jgi:hypothetical protein
MVSPEFERKLLVGETGISIEEFLSMAVMEWVS